MVKVYVNLIRMGLKTLDDVPMRLWEEVRKALGNEVNRNV